MKAHRGRRGISPPILNPALDTDEDCFTPQPHYLPSKCARYPQDKRPGGLHSWSGRFGECHKSPLSGIEPIFRGKSARAYRHIVLLAHRYSWHRKLHTQNVNFKEYEKRRLSYTLFIITTPRRDGVAI